MNGGGGGGGVVGAQIWKDRIYGDFFIQQKVMGLCRFTISLCPTRLATN